MENALSAWKQSMYGHNTGSLNTLNFNRASLTLYRIANLTLYASIVELQIVAGLPKIMGKPVPEIEQKRILKKMCTTWIQSEGAFKAVHHAVKLLKETLFSSSQYLPILNRNAMNAEFSGPTQRADYFLDGILHGKWCLYLATLTIWAYGALSSINETSDGIVNELTMYGQGIQSSGGDFYTSNDYHERDEPAAWMHALAYLNHVIQLPDKEPDKAKRAFLCSPNRIETRGVVIIIRNLLQNERWQLRIYHPKMLISNGLVREGSAVLSNILANQHLIATIPFNTLGIYESESRRMSMVDGSGGEY
jgi:hypothetical protein